MRPSPLERRRFLHGGNRAEVQGMCGRYPLEARYVCERCFGPLEIAYDHAALGDDVGALRRRIQAGPQNIWRYSDFLPLDAPPGPSGRNSSRVGLPAGCTPLIRADRLAERLGLDEVWVKNDAHNPTHSFKDRVVAIALAARPRARLRHARLRLDRQPRQRGRRPGRRAGHAVLRLHPGRSRGAEDPRDRRLRHATSSKVARQLRRRQPPLHRGLRRARELGVRERQHAPVLRRGLEDRRLRDRRAARLGAARPLRRADRVRARCSRRSPRASRSGPSSACSTATSRR